MEAGMIMPQIPVVESSQPQWASSLLAMTDKFHSKLTDMGGQIGNQIKAGLDNTSLRLQGFKTDLTARMPDKNTVKKSKQQLVDWYKQFRGQDPITKKTWKERQKQAKYLWQNMKSMGIALKGILKAVSANLLMDILKFVLLLAVFDPQGKFLMSILEMLGSVMKMLWNMIKPWIPILFGRMINIITTVIPEILKKVITGVFTFLNEEFTKLANEAKSGPAKWIFEQLASIFDPNGGLANFLKIIAGFFPYFVMILGAMKVFSMIISVISFMGTVFSIIGTVLSGLGTVLGLILTWPGLIIVGLVAVGYLIYKYWDNIKAFFAKAWKIIKSFIPFLWKALKLGIKNALSIFIAPIMAIWNAIKPVINMIAKVFEPVGEVLSKIWNLIKNTILKAFDSIMEGFAIVGDYFAAISDLGLSFFDADTRSTYMDTRKEAREKGIDMGKVEASIEGDTGIVLNKAEQQMKRTIQAQEGEEFSDKMKSFAKKGSEATQAVKNIKAVTTAPTPNNKR